MNCRLRMIALLAGFAGVSVLAAPPDQKRAPIPKWGDDAKGIFFDDAFVEALSGSRPESLGSRNSTGKPPRQDGESPKQAPAVGSEWSKLISPESMQEEMKAIKIEIDRIVTTPSRFRGGGYQEARLQFTTATVLFGIAAEYGAKTRWQEYAGGARDLFGRAAANCKVGDIRAYNEAKLRKADLHDVVSGSRLNVPESNPDATWDQLVNRSPLMQRLEIAHEKRLTQWTASEASFKQNIDKVKREAELIAALAHLLKQDQMEDTGDDTYEGYCAELKNGAVDLVAAVAKNDAEKARLATGAIGQSCSHCHEDYQ